MGRAPREVALDLLGTDGPKGLRPGVCLGCARIRVAIVSLAVACFGWLP